MISWNSRKVVITGGMGFLGSALARALVSRGAIVTLVDSMEPRFGAHWMNIQDIRSDVRIVIRDIREREAIAEWLTGQDVLFNLAAQTSHADSMAHPFEDFEINAAAQLAILEACREHIPDATVIYGSTRQIYGKPRFLPVTEDHPIVPPDVNGINKLTAEHYHRLYHQVYGLKTCSLRLTNCYGPGMRVVDARQTFIGIWLRRVLENEPFLVFGDGQQIRDFTFVDDVVSAFLCAAVSPGTFGQAFNVGGADALSLSALADLLVKIAGQGQWLLRPFPAERAAIDIGDFTSDFQRFTAATGWTPRVSLADGLQQTLDYYRAHLPAYLAPPGSPD